MKLAKELMTTSPHIVQSGHSLDEVMKLFLDKNITSAPVVSSQGDIMGIIDELVLIKAFLMNHLKPEAKEKVVHHEEFFHPHVSVKEGDSLGDVVKQLIHAPTNRVLVTNNSGQIRGIISPKDILNFLNGENIKIADLNEELEKAQNEIKKLKDKLHDLKGALNTYKDIYHESPIMMHSIDANGTIVMANEKLHEELGYDDNELIGKSIQDLYAQTVHHEAMHGLQKIINDGYHHSTYTTMIKKNGEKVRVDIASSALWDTEGRFQNTITVSRLVDSEHLLRALHGVLNDEELED